MYCMAYNNIISYQLNLKSLVGDKMRLCVNCDIEFNDRHRADCCSLKCKILANIRKEENGCWLYKNSCSGSYGKIRWQGKWYSAHRISYEQFIGVIPSNMWVCHKCDVPKCVNPEHLFVGTASENRKDCFKKKRSAVGEDHYAAKFSNDQIKEMRLLKKEGLTYLRLKRIFNCSQAYLWYIIKNKMRIGD